MDTISNVKNPTTKAGDGMLHILLCDDDAIFTETLKRLIEAQPEFNRRYMQIECVHDPNALKKAAVQKADMIFLDIDMGDVNGIALARQMRTIRKDAVLIFVTNYGEYAAEGYEVSAFRFLPKLQLAEKLPDYFRQALAACRSRTRTLNVLCDGEGTNIVLDELVYVETEERILIFHRAEPAAPLKSRMSLRTLEEKLAEEGFLRVHNSFLVNMSYIATLQTSGVTLTTAAFFSALGSWTHSICIYRRLNSGCASISRFSASVNIASSSHSRMCSIPSPASIVGFLAFEIVSKITRPLSLSSQIASL